MVCTQTRGLKTRCLLTTSFGLLLAGTTPARHRQKDRESINDLRCSSTCCALWSEPPQDRWTRGFSCRTERNWPALPHSSFPSLVVSLSLSPSNTRHQAAWDPLPFMSSTWLHFSPVLIEKGYWSICIRQTEWCCSIWGELQVSSRSHRAFCLVHVSSMRSELLHHREGASHQSPAMHMFWVAASLLSTPLLLRACIEKLILSRCPPPPPPFPSSSLPPSLFLCTMPCCAFIHLCLSYTTYCKEYPGRSMSFVLIKY